MNEFKYTLIKVKSKEKAPPEVKNVDWLWNKVCGKWTGKEAIIVALDSATKDEIALAIYHEKAHFLLKHKGKYFTLIEMFDSESKAWKKTYEILPEKFKTKHVRERLICDYYGTWGFMDI